MSYFVTKYPHGTFSWADVSSTDFKKSKEFLEKLMGWTSQDIPTMPGMPDYTMFHLDGKAVAGGSPTFMPNMPSVWNNYVTVSDLDAVVKNVEQLGGKIVAQPMDVMDAGRMAAIIDPTGAAISLWQAKNHIGAQVVNTVGAMCWNELYTPDIEKAKEFYGQLLGWTFTVDEKGYVTIHNNGRANGGMMQITKDMGPMPPNWTPYFTVKNIEESINKTEELDGNICFEPKDISVGKIAMIADPTNAAFMIIELSVPPEEWKE